MDHIDFPPLDRGFRDLLDELLNLRNDPVQWAAAKEYYGPKWAPLLKQLDPPAGSRPISDDFDVDNLDTEAEVTKLFKDIREYGSVIASDDVSAKNTYFRVSASLLEKLVTLREKAAGQKAFDRFVEFVISVHEDLLTKDQSNEFRQRLEDHMEQTKDGS